MYLVTMVFWFICSSGIHINRTCKMFKHLSTNYHDCMHVVLTHTLTSNKITFVSFFHSRPLKSSTNPHFQNEAKCPTFLVKMSLFAWEWKIIYISKAQHLTSFWYSSQGKLRNGLFTSTESIPFSVGANSWLYFIEATDQVITYLGSQLTV